MIKANNLSKTYENGTIAIDDISFELPEFGMVAITGTSGCGKSTLLNLLANNDTLTSGQITYNDKNCSEIGAEQPTLDFAYIYQDFKLIDNLTAYQNIMIGHELATADIDYDFVINIAKELGIEDFLDQKVFSLSGGQMQRVAIARAIARKPKVIFADEPTGNLDSNNSINVYNILKKISKDILVVVVSHDSQICTWADRVITLSDGKIVADEKGEGIAYVDAEKRETTDEDEEIEQILQLQTAKKQKKTSEFFSYKNKPKGTHKKARLSSKSALGLSVALLNKDVVKKVFLTIVMVILIALMTLSCAMTFATSEKTMAKAINASSGKKVFAVSPFIDNPRYNISNEDMAKFDELLKNSGLKNYEIATGEVIAHNWADMHPNNDDVVKVAYFANMDLNNMQNAIFTDNVDDVGIKIVLGKAPKEVDEIAISKSFYEYFMYYKNFEVGRLNDNPDDNPDDNFTGTSSAPQQIEFTEDNFLNNEQIVSIFGVKICGVFDDKNGLDSSLKTKNVANITEEEAEQLNEILDAEYKTNPFINLVVKCGKARGAWDHFSGVNSNMKMTIGNGYATGVSDYFFNFAPINDDVIGYFRLDSTIKEIKLNENEIVLDKTLLNKINAFLRPLDENEKIEEGDTITMSILGMLSIGTNALFPQNIFDTKEIKIAKVVDDFGFNNTIFMSQETYNKFNFVPKFSQKRMISGDHISASSLAKVNKGFVKFASGKFENHTNCGVTYSINNCPLTSSNDYGAVYICQQFVSIPLMIASILMVVGIIVVFYFDFVKTKAKDLLVLKSLGAKTKDFFSIYGIFSVVLIAIQMLFGLVIGSVLIYAMNIFMSQLSGYLSTFNIFYLDSFSWIFTIVAVLVVNVVSLVISLYGINNKNLRKSFQKLKK